MKISIIVAIDKNGAIGKNGDLPWKLGTDLKMFKKTTMGKPIIMGRKTFDSIGRPLPGRKNIVMSRNPSLDIDGVIQVGSIDEAIIAAGNVEEIMIIGGGQIYEIFKDEANYFYITEVNTVIDKPDAFFTSLNKNRLKEMCKQYYPISEIDEYDFTIYEFEK